MIPALRLLAILSIAAVLIAGCAGAGSREMLPGAPTPRPSPGEPLGAVSPEAASRPVIGLRADMNAGREAAHGAANASPTKAEASSGGVGCSSPGAGEQGQSDGSWAQDAVDFAMRCGLWKSATPPAEYGRAVTPEEWNAMVVPLFGAPAGATTDDSDPRYWVWFYTGGLAKDGGIQRQWAIGGLIKLLSMHGRLSLPDITGDFIGEHLSRFHDAGKIDDANTALMAMAVSGGLVGGYPDGTLRPAQPLSVAEAAALLRRIRGLASRVTKPELLLDLPLGLEPHFPGVTSDRLGGESSKGPLSFAVGPDGVFYVLDSARGRIIFYSTTGYVRSIDVPFLGEEAHDLLVRDGLIYVRDDRGEYEIEPPAPPDQDGRIRRLGPPGDGTLYPRSRSKPDALGLDKERDRKGHLLGQDEAGNRYVIAYADQDGWVVRRLDGAGRETARVPVPSGQIVDWHLTPQGGVYTLTWEWDSGTITRARVYRILPPAASHTRGAPGASPGTRREADEAPSAPVALGHPAPQFLKVQTPEWLPVEIHDPVVIHNLWHLLSNVTSAPPDAPPPPENRRTLTVTAYLPGDKRLELRFDDSGVMADGRRYWGGTDRAQRLLESAVFTPANLRLAIESGPVSVVIPDLPGVARLLGPDERHQLLAALELSYRAGRYEPPQPLPEESFPRYALRVGLKGGGEATIDLAGDRYLYLHDRAVAIAHTPNPARVGGLVREWLPVPQARPGEPAYLYRAMALTITQGGRAQDLTRWKATVVRALLGVGVESPPEDDAAPLTFTFVVDGRPQVVRVTKDGFTYAGKTYTRRGLPWLARLQGVP